MKKIFLVFIALGMLNCNLFGQTRVFKSEIEKIDDIVFYSGQKFNGTVVDKFRESLFSETDYINGKIDGTKKRYHRNGQLKDIAHFENGKRNGLTKYYGRDGFLMQEINYKNGKKNGEEKEWHTNGQLKVEKNYRKGKEISFKEWDENGNIIREN